MRFDWKKNNRWFVLLVFALLLSACSAREAAQSAAQEHDKLVELYFAAVASQSNFSACVDASTAKINLMQSTYATYTDTEVARVAAWRQNIDRQTEKLDEARDAFNSVTPNENGVIDLNEMVASGGTPADVASGFALTVQAYAPTEAVLPVLPTEVTLFILAEQSEATSMMFGCVVDWNEAAQAYNAERNKLNQLVNSGEVIGAAANAIGINDLPETLPYYQSTPENSTIPTFGD